MHFVEAKHFRTWERVQFACIKQANFWMSVVVLLCVLLVLLVILDEDWKMVYGLMAVSNTVMLWVVILLLGYGLAEYPISLWHEARMAPSLRRFRTEAWQQHVKLTRVSHKLAAKLALVHDIRQRATSSLRHLGRQIQAIANECPVDVTHVLLMHPVRGPSIPATLVEKEAALLAALQQVERERDLGSDMSEVDAWVEALETAHVLPRDADVPALQDALYAASLRTMGDMDYLDPIFGDAYASHRQRLDSVLKALQALLSLPPPDAAGTIVVCGDGSRSGAAALAHVTLQKVAEAVIRRNDASLHANRGIFGDDFLMPAAGGAGPDEAGMDGAAAGGGLSGGAGRGGAAGGRATRREWTEAQLVVLRTEVHQLAREYRKAKRRFEIAAVNAILLQDLDAAYNRLLPLGNMCATLYVALGAPAIA